MSLYKFLDAFFGAVLMGSKEIIDRARLLRHIYGGQIFTGWQTALPALHALNNLQQNYIQAYERFTLLLSALTNTTGFSVERIQGGTNVAFLRVCAGRLAGLTERLAAADVYAFKPVDGLTPLFANLCILRRSTEESLSPFTNG